MQRKCCRSSEESRLYAMVANGTSVEQDSDNGRLVSLTGCFQWALRGGKGPSALQGHSKRRGSEVSRDC